MSNISYTFFTEFWISVSYPIFNNFVIKQIISRQGRRKEFIKYWNLGLQFIKICLDKWLHPSIYIGKDTVIYSKIPSKSDYKPYKLKDVTNELSYGNGTLGVYTWTDENEPIKTTENEEWG